jgi:hypothetical protein
MAYAENTTVSTEKSRAEIERILQRYGADSFMYGWDQQRAIVGFQAEGRQLRFVVEMPLRTERRFTHHPKGARTSTAAYNAWEQACRQRWRALALVIKAKLEAVEAGISEFEAEFLANIMLPDGSTVGDWVRPQVEQAYLTGAMPSMLPALTAGGADG